MRLTLPESVNDFLFGDLQKKHALEEQIRRLFFLWGYDEVLPAGLDFYDNFTYGAGARPQADMLKSFDGQGRILVMRPEFTAQIARLVSTKLRGQEPPLRLCYLGAAYENLAKGQAGRLAEFTQAGVELMGEAKCEADAEIVMLALSCMRASGLAHPLIELGQVNFFKGLMEEAGLDKECILELQRHVEQKNTLAIELLLRARHVDQNAARRILELPMLFGGEEVLQRAEGMSKNPACADAIRNIKDVYTLLCACGLQEYISIDLGMVGSLGYYTGVVFRGIADSFGSPLLTGGRYDTLLGDYGRPLPATGFALGIESLLEALKGGEDRAEEPGVDVLYVVTAQNLGAAWPHILALRDQGLRVELCFECDEARIAAHQGRRQAKRLLYAKEAAK